MSDQMMIMPALGVRQLEQEYRELPDGRIGCYGRSKTTNPDWTVTYTEWELISCISGGPALLKIAAACGQPVKRLESPWERAKAAVRRYFWRG